MQLTMVYGAAALVVWTLIGLIITGVFVAHRPQDIQIVSRARLWFLGTLLWPFTVWFIFRR